MAIKFACPTCQHAFKTDEKFAGRQATCPSCQNKLTIPNAASAEPELIPAVDRPVAYNPKPSRSASPPSRPFDDGDLNENFNPFASPQAEDTRPTFAATGEYETPDFVEYGGTLTRWVASILDCLITGFVLIIGIVIIGIGAATFIGAELEADEESPIVLVVGLMFYAILFGVPWLYEALMVSSSRQATLGKLALGLKVTDLNGQPVSFGQATGRHFGKYISGLLFGLGYFMQAFDPKGQALHDKLAGCLVIRSR